MHRVTVSASECLAGNGEGGFCLAPAHRTVLVAGTTGIYTLFRCDNHATPAQLQAEFRPLHVLGTFPAES